MSTELEAIPLLTLPAVLFPGTFLPIALHEHGQRALLSACTESSRRLGVVYAHPDAAGAPLSPPSSVGCLASVAFLLHQNEQPMHAILFGEHRIRLTEISQQAPYPLGCAAMMDELDGVNAQQRTRQAGRVFQQYLSLIRQRYQADITHVPLPDDPTAASYLLASALYVSVETKQHWLESATAALRLEAELAYLTDECERLTTFLTLTRGQRHAYTLPDYEHLAGMISLN
ncbi:MAG TPA: LON peptidase substrate-binding domain-containing protein [Armatimonadota bacterium]|nr:LON peptidase substrate-binding domain-containing protein [Armatimonadota bacterium]